MKFSKPAHERILQAAFGLISDKGYAAVSTRKIACGPAWQQVTLFRYFTGKEKLFSQTV